MDIDEPVDAETLDDGDYISFGEDTDVDGVAIQEAPATSRSLAVHSSYISSTSVSDLSSLGSPFPMPRTDPIEPADVLDSRLPETPIAKRVMPPTKASTNQPRKPFDALCAGHFFPFTPADALRTPPPKREGDPTPAETERLTFVCGERVTSRPPSVVPLRDELYRCRGRGVVSPADVPSQLSVTPSPPSQPASANFERATVIGRRAKRAPLDDKTLYGRLRPGEFDMTLQEALAKDQTGLTAKVFTAWLNDLVEAAEPDAPPITLKKINKAGRLVDLDSEDEVPRALFRPLPGSLADSGAKPSISPTPIASVRTAPHGAARISYGPQSSAKVSRIDCLAEAAAASAAATRAARRAAALAYNAPPSARHSTSRSAIRFRSATSRVASIPPMADSISTST
jgi:hypothetical protein